jgi:hypothetical protein
MVQNMTSIARGSCRPLENMSNGHPDLMTYCKMLSVLGTEK